MTTRNVLIAEPRDILRAGLKSIFLEDIRVTNIYEAATTEELETQLKTYSIDLAFVNQALITDITKLPRGNFVILAAELNMEHIKEAYNQGARGYVSVNVSAELLRTTLSQAESAFLIEPIIVPWIFASGENKAHTIVKDELLTPREREIVSLLREGIDKPAIAKQLSITETTLKTHIKNITRKSSDRI